MKAIIDGTVTEISPERWAAFEAFEKGEAKDWPQAHDVYFFIDADGKIEHVTWDDDESDQASQSIGNIYRTESEALAQVEKLKAKARIDKYIRDNGLEFVPDWKDAAQTKWSLFYKYALAQFGVRCCYEFQDSERVYATDSHAQQVIDNCTDDLKTLFGVN